VPINASPVAVAVAAAAVVECLAAGRFQRAQDLRAMPIAHAPRHCRAAPPLCCSGPRRSPRPDLARGRLPLSARSSGRDAFVMLHAGGMRCRRGLPVRGPARHAPRPGSLATG
jgi:hypothetical protein